MTQKVLTYLLVTVIAMQSFVAMADVHQPHQSGNQHLEFEHAHEDFEVQKSFLDELGNVKNLSTALDDVSSLDEYDCHHCCHCHSVSYLKAAGLGNEVIPYKSNLFLSLSVDYLFYTPSPDLRPPIV